MFHILGFLFIIIVVILVIGLSIIGTVLRSIFGLGGKRRTSSGTYQNGNGSYQPGGGGYSFSGSQQQTSSSQNSEENASSASGNDNRGKRKKLFSKDEGEYVDFEEIKE